MKRWLSLLLAAVLLLSLAACAKKQDEPKTGKNGELVTADQSLKTDFVCEDNNRVFYELFVGSFSDSDGDGIGDLRGIINRMDYLNDGDPNSGLSLGVEGIWLTPIFTSPSYHKYDAADYYTVDPDFGTEADLKELAELCHERNVKLIIDLVLNHTSTKHPWFQEFVAAQKSGNQASEYYNYYTWCEKDAKPSGRAFSKIAGTERYYECNFWDQMPELNYDNPKVRQAVLEVARHYLELGVDGFRFDAAKYLYFGDEARNVEFWTWYIDELKAINPEVYTIAEVWDTDGVTDQYFAALNCFNFTASQSNGMIAAAAMRGDVNRFTTYLESYVNNIRSIRADAFPALFVANHDTDRAAGYLTVGSNYMQMAANLYILGPGSPFIYYGEELGMVGSRGTANTDANRRLAMVWGDEDTVENPEGTTYPASSQIEHGAADQVKDEDSLYTYYKKLLMIRHANPEIARGDYTALRFTDTKLGGFVSTWNGSSVCVLHNTTMNEITVDLSEVTDLTFAAIAASIGQGEVTLDGTKITVGPQTSVVLR